MHIAWSICLLISEIGGGTVIPPNLCEQTICDPSLTFCSLSVPGLYRHLGAACSAGSSCTACIQSSAGEIQCVCETLPFRTYSEYGQPCGLSSDCSVGSCFRPCSTYLFAPDCPADRCVWTLNPVGGTCVDFSPRRSLPMWTEVVSRLPLSSSEEVRGQAILSATHLDSMFPITFDSLKRAATDYLVNNEASIPSLVPMETFFLLLDQDVSGSISKDEFSTLPTVLSSVSSPIIPSSFTVNERRLQQEDSTQLVPALTGSDIAKCLSLTAQSPPSLVAACQDPNLQGLICNADSGKFYCHLTKSCLDSCSSGCSWLNAGNVTSFRCTIASTATCQSKYFCPSLSSCVSDCSACTGLVYPDTSGKICRSEWWGSAPPDSGWLCALRKSSAQSCISDMDCVYGARRCNSTTKICEPASETCSVDRDCGIGQHCPSDPTGGEDPYFIHNCKPQGKAGDPCFVDGDCSGEFRCNLRDMETKNDAFPGICRSLFSLSSGLFVSDPFLCQSGQTTVGGACTGTFKSRRLGQVCSTDEDCPTYDASGSLGSCICIGWWDPAGAGPCKRCNPVIGDYSNHAQSYKIFLSNQASFCASFWTLSECLSESSVVQQSYYRYMCEQQTLAGGVSLLSPGSGCMDDKALTDYCALSFEV